MQQQPTTSSASLPQQPPPPQMASGGSTNFEAQETMQGDGVAQTQQTPNDTTQPTETPVMENGGEVVNKNTDGLDWGLVFTFFNFKDE